MASTARPDLSATLPQGAAQYAISIPIKSRYDNWIDGGFRAGPQKGSISRLRPSRAAGGGRVRRVCTRMRRVSAGSMTSS